MNQNSSAWLAPASLAAIIGLTLVALVIAPVLGSSDETSGAILVAALAVVSVADLLLVRLVLLPNLVKHPESSQENATFVGYSIALAPAILGVAGSAFTGQGLVALPFGAFSLLFWNVVRQFLQDAYADEQGSGLREHRR